MNLKNTFNEDSFEYTTMNDIIAEGMKQPKREPLYKNLWYENEPVSYTHLTLPTICSV